MLSCYPSKLISQVRICKVNPVYMYKNCNPVFVYGFSVLYFLCNNSFFQETCVIHLWKHDLLQHWRVFYVSSIDISKDFM